MIVVEGGGSSRKVSSDIYQRKDSELGILRSEKDKLKMIFKSSQNNILHKILTVGMIISFPAFVSVIIGSIIISLNIDISEGTKVFEAFQGVTGMFSTLWYVFLMLGLFSEEKSIPSKISEWITSAPFKLYDRLKLKFIKSKSTLKDYIISYINDATKNLYHFGEDKFHSIENDKYILKLSYLETRKIVFMHLFDKERNKTIISNVTKHKGNFISEISYFQDISLDEEKEQKNIIKIYQDMIYNNDHLQHGMKEYLKYFKETKKKNLKEKVEERISNTDQTHNLINEKLINIDQPSIWQKSQIDRIQKIFDQYKNSNVSKPDAIKKINEYLLPEAAKMITLYSRHSNDKLIRQEIEKTTNEYIDRISKVIHDAIEEDTHSILQNSKTKLKTHDMLEEKVY